MNISEFRDKYPQYNDIDDQTLATKFHDKYYADIPMEKFNSDFLGSQPSTQKISRSVPKSWMKRTAQAIAPYARPTLEMGGALAGAALAAPGNIAAPGLASIGGAGLGYAAGRQAANALEEYAGTKKPSTLGESFTSAALAIPEGAAMEAGGAILGKGIQYGLQKVAQAAPRIYESVAKIAPRSVPKFERDKAIKTALDYEIPATQKGLGKLRGKIEDLNTQISDVIEGANKTGKATIPIKSILNRLEDVKSWASKSFADPTPVLKSIDEYKAGVLNNRGQEISVSDAQKLKQGIYKRLTDSAYGEYSTPSKEMDKSFARGIKEELVAQFPQLQKLNSDDSALISLNNILEKTVNRTRNWDMAGLSEYAGAIGGAELAGAGGAGIGLVVSKILRSPAVMSRVAFALNKAGKVAAPALASRAAAYGMLGKSPEQQQEDIRRYKPMLGSLASKLDPASPAAAEEIPSQGQVKNLNNSVSQFGSSINDIYRDGYSDINSPSRPVKNTNKIPDSMTASTSDIGKAKIKEKGYTGEETEAVPGMTSEQKATDAYLNSDYSKAIDYFRKAMKENPKMSEKYRQAINTILKEQKAAKDKGYKVAKNDE